VIRVEDDPWTSGPDPVEGYLRALRRHEGDEAAACRDAGVALRHLANLREGYPDLARREQMIRDEIDVERAIQGLPAKRWRHCQWTDHDFVAAWREHGSVTRVARELGCDVSTASKRLKRLVGDDPRRRINRSRAGWNVRGSE
jgi:hypothetical protein